MTKQERLRQWIQNHKALINDAPDQAHRDYIVMMWQGYLNGLRLANYITYQEYRSLNEELRAFAAGEDAA